jgi:hypothetical protein
MEILVFYVMSDTDTYWYSWLSKKTLLCIVSVKTQMLNGTYIILKKL